MRPTLKHAKGVFTLSNTTKNNFKYMANTTFQIQYLHPEKGLQLAFEVAISKEAARAKFSHKNDYRIISCTPTTVGYGQLKS